MPDILHVITDKSVGGAGIFLTHLLDPRDTRTGSLVLLPTGSPLCSRLAACGIPFETFPLARESSFSPRSLRALYQHLARRRPALLVSHAALSARVAAKLLGIPAISVRHCDTRISPVTLPLYNLLTQATVATSRPLAEHLTRAGIKNVFALENGYTPMGVPKADERLAARAALGLPRDKLIIGIVGRLSPIKGQATALRALARTGEKGKNILLSFLGEGEDKARLLSLSAALSLRDRVRFLGYRADTRPFYHAIDVHLSSSLGSETSSLALAEGMSAALPTLASDTPGNRARLGTGGLLFPAGDDAALASLFLLLRARDTRERLSRAAEARAKALPTWEDVKESYRALFAAFCDKLPPNGCIFGKDMLS